MIVKDDEEVKSVTQQFCEWVSSLGGDSNNIDEATITSLFASGYETKPALSVPIHVVELANVPPELRLSSTLPPAPPSQPTTARPRSLGCARVSHSLLAKARFPLPQLTTRVDGWPVYITRQHGPCW